MQPWGCELKTNDAHRTPHNFFCVRLCEDEAVKTMQPWGCELKTNDAHRTPHTKNRRKNPAVCSHLRCNLVMLSA